MTMNMSRAFNSRMMTKLTRYFVAEGTYDDNNNWIEGTKTKSTFFGVVLAGNRFSQFDEGISLHPEDGGARFSDYRSLYINDKYTLAKEDYVGFKGKYFRVIQQADESVFGFNSYIIEKSEDWTP